jgi:hypothetical protein
MKYILFLSLLLFSCNSNFLDEEMATNLPLYEIANETLEKQLRDYLDSVKLPDVEEKMPIVTVDYSGNRIFFGTIQYATSAWQLLDSAMVLFAKIDEQLVAFSYTHKNRTETIKLPTSLAWQYLKMVFKTEYEHYLKYRKIQSSAINGTAWKIGVVDDLLVKKEITKFSYPMHSVFYEKNYVDEESFTKNNLVYYEIINEDLKQVLLRYMDSIIVPETPSRILQVSVVRGLDDTTVFTILYNTFCPVSLGKQSEPFVYTYFENQMVSFTFNDDYIWFIKQNYPNVSVVTDDFWLDSLLSIKDKESTEIVEEKTIPNFWSTSLFLPDSVLWEYVKDIFVDEYRSRDSEIQAITFSTEGVDWVSVFRGNKIILRKEPEDVLGKNRKALINQSQ